MSHITLDEPILAKLRSLTERVEVRDANGNIVGMYTPVPQPMTPEERNRIAGMFDLKKARETAERERHLARPFSEIIERLKARENLK